MVGMAGNARTNRTAQHARALFLAELARRGVVSGACKAANIARRTSYEWRDADAQFAADWQAALDVAIDAAEAEAYRRGVEGWDEPVFGRVGKDQDGEVGTIRRHSDAMLNTILKANRPEKFRERTDVQHSGAIEIQFVNDWRTGDT